MVVVLKEDEEQFLTRIANVAKENKIFLVAALNTKVMGSKLSEKRL
jgi:hypothetical protein